MENASLSNTLKLKGAENWPVWRFQTEVIMRSRGVLGIASGAETCPSDESSKTWNSKDAKAQEIIATRMEEEPLTHLFSCTTSAEMWSKLRAVYDRESTVSVHLLQQKFFSMTIEKGEPMSKFFSRIEELKTKLKLAAEPVTDNMIITKILMSLPEPFKHFRSAWESVPVEKQNLNEMMSRLLIEEERLSSSEEVVALAAPKSKQSVTCFNCGRSGHYAKYCNEKEKRECYVCKKKGHISSQCRNKKKGNRKRTPETKEKDLNAFMGLSGPEGTQTENVWYLDTGASEHMCGKRELFETLTERRSVSRVKVGDGKLLYVNGIGTVVVYAWDNKKYRKTILSNVLYVPELKFNLLSAGHVLDKGFHLVSDSEQCQFVDKEGEVRAVANRVNKLYMMNFVQNETECNNLFECNFSEFDTSNCHLIERLQKLSDWHKRLAHQNLAHVKRYLQQENIKFEDDSSDFDCEQCLGGKQQRFPFFPSGSRAKTQLEIIHADLCGPMETTSLGGNRYVLVLKDDFSGYRTVYFLIQKSANEVTKCFEKYIAKAERETEQRVKIIRTDNGKEFVNSQMKDMLEKRGIIHQKSCPYSPQQNGRAEREIRTLVEAARAMIHGMEKKFWAEAMSTAAFTLNRTGSCPTSKLTPYEAYYNKKGCDVKFFKEFGCKVSIHIPKEKRLKWDPKSTVGYFVGYGEDVKGYRVYVPTTQRVENHRDVIFLHKSKVVSCEHQITQREAFESSESFEIENTSVEESSEIDNQRTEEVGETEIIQAESESANESFKSLDDLGIEEEENPSEEEELTRTKYNLRPRENIKPPARYNDYTAHDDISFISCEENLSFNEVVRSEERSQWEDAMERELKALEENETWEIVKKPSFVQLIDCKWVFRRKNCSYKARLVARGFLQFNIFDVYSPVARLPSIRIFLAFCNENKLAVHQLDVCSAFLNGDVTGDVYITLPNGCERIKLNENECLKLKKSLYGLKESPKNWNRKFNDVMNTLGFIQSQFEYCLYVKSDKNYKTYIVLYVDDVLLASTCPRNVQFIKEMLNQNFKMKDLGLINTFLGINVTQDIDNNCIRMSQRGYLENLLEKCNMSQCNAVFTPMQENYDHSILKREKTENIELEKRCRMVIGSLMYAMLCSRPDLCLSLSILSRYQSCASNDLWNAIKHVLRYVKGTLDLSLVFKKVNCHEPIIGFVDSDFAGDKVDRKSTGGLIFKVFNCSVIWGSKKQATVALSSTESEFLALCLAVTEACWIRNLYKDLVGNDVKVTINEDNQSVIKICKNPRFLHKLKHVDIKLCFIKEKLSSNIVNLEYIETNNQLADIFTKPLGRIKFKKFVELLGLE